MKKMDTEKPVIISVFVNNNKMAHSHKSDYLVKLIIIGDCGVGKTNILMRYCEGTFKHNYVSTIGVDFKIKSLQVGDTRLKFQIWDTAGQ